MELLKNRDVQQVISAENQPKALIGYYNRFEYGDEEYGEENEEGNEYGEEESDNDYGRENIEDCCEEEEEERYAGGGDDSYCGVPR